MQIAFDAKRLFNNSTGLGHYSRFIINALLQHYPNTPYWLYTPQYTSRQATNSITAHTSVTVKTPSRWVSAMGMASYWRSVELGKVALQDGADIFHGLSNELPIMPAKGLKTIVTIHDVIFKRYPQFYNPIDVKIYALKVRKACQKADRIVAISRQTADDLHTYFGVNKDKVRIVYQGCNAIFTKRKTAQEIASVRLKYNLPSTFLLTVGTIEHRKNALLTVKALTRINSSTPLVIVGRPTKYIHTIRHYIQKNHLQSRVLFLHNVAFQDLPALYQMAKIFVYPSFFEGFGIPIIEAIASRTPVITSKGSCFAEAGGPASKYIDPTDENELATAIATITSDELLQKEMVEQSQQYIARFAAHRIAQSLMRVYEGLLAEN